MASALSSSVRSQRHRLRALRERAASRRATSARRRCRARDAPRATARIVQVAELDRAIVRVQREPGDLAAAHGDAATRRCSSDRLRHARSSGIGVSGNASRSIARRSPSRSSIVAVAELHAARQRSASAALSRSSVKPQPRLASARTTGVLSTGSTSGRAGACVSRKRTVSAREHLRGRAAAAPRTSAGSDRRTRGRSRTSTPAAPRPAPNAASTLPSRSMISSGCSRSIASTSRRTPARSSAPRATSRRRG